MSGSAPTRGIAIGLHAAVVAVAGDRPLILTVPGTLEDGTQRDGLPFGPFDPPVHKTFEVGLRRWVQEQTGLMLGYVEQLYTFGDYGRLPETSEDAHMVSVGYLALSLAAEDRPAADLHWASWYDYFPWEDWRSGLPSLLPNHIAPGLQAWLAEAGKPREQKHRERLARIRLAFGQSFDGGSWDEERVLERYELMYEAGLVEEAVQDGRIPDCRSPVRVGEPMLHDHRRILATAIARLRGKLKYRPVVFELLPERFTLTELQHTVETLSGRRVHKQNFRRMVEKARLVEPTGAMTSHTGGRPAAYYRFRRSIQRERPAPGLKLGTNAGSP